MRCGDGHPRRVASSSRYNVVDELMKRALGDAADAAEAVVEYRMNRTLVEVAVAVVEYSMNRAFVEVAKVGIEDPMKDASG